MTKPIRKHASGPVRPIRTKRDYEAATAVVKKMSGEADQKSAAELRLQSLLRELDKFEEQDDDTSMDLPEDDNYGGPRRRWSDD